MNDELREIMNLIKIVEKIIIINLLNIEKV